MNNNIQYKVNENEENNMSANPQQDEQITIASRFGEVTINLANAISFPHGILGFPEGLHFALADVPRENMERFKLLQCLNNHEMSFVVLPLDNENTLIEKDDVVECCTTLNIDPANLLTLLVVSVQRTPEGTKITANVRAPIMVDVNDQAAIQYVFPTNKYDICHQL